jgi:hypothetical protein
MSWRFLRPSYLYHFYVGFFALSVGVYGYFQGSKNYWPAIDIAVLALLVGVFVVLIERYNKRRSSAPISPWLSRLWLAITLLIGGSIYYFSGGLIYGIVFGLAALVAAESGLLYFKEESRKS